MLKKALFFLRLILKRLCVQNHFNTVGAPNLSTTPYRTLPFSVRIFITLAVTLREAYRTFSLKYSVFPLEKSKARTVPYLK